LIFQRRTGTSIEIFCLSPYQPADYQLAFFATGSCTWECMIGNMKKWKNESLELRIRFNKKTLILCAEKIKITENGVLVYFTWNVAISFERLLEITGAMPIPPYLKRNAESIDEERYQTTYSKFSGSVAAPTAGLHFTPEILNRFKLKNIHLHEITLHVGAGTFQPINSENIMEHQMHPEFFSVEIDTLKKLANIKGPVIVTGTTTLRTLESIYWLALRSMQEHKIITSLDQWEHLSIEPFLSYKDAVTGLISLMEKQGLHTFSARTKIMIVPGYEFQVVDVLITNFHQPKSTLLILIAAFIGNDWKNVYKFALENDFRFLSYGDSSLLFRTRKSNASV